MAGAGKLALVGGFIVEHLNPGLMIWKTFSGPILYFVCLVGGFCGGFGVGRWHAKWGGEL